MLQELEAYKAAVDTSNDIRTSLSVTLSGATEIRAQRINQRFVATEESANGAPVFVSNERLHGGRWKEKCESECQLAVGQI